jgi:hypothetical protein
MCVHQSKVTVKVVHIVIGFAVEFALLSLVTTIIAFVVVLGCWWLIDTANQPTCCRYNNGLWRAMLL